MRKVLFILGELEDSDLQWLRDAGTTRRIRAGEVLIREGVPNDALFITLDGQLAVKIAARGGEEIARLGVGEVAGDMSLLDSRPPNATVVAATDGQVFAVPQSALRAKLERDRRFASNLYRALAIFLANRLNRALLMGSSQSDARLRSEDADELPIELLDSVHLAGERFVQFLGQVREP